MRKKLLGTSAIGVAIIAIGLVATQQPEKQYTPRQSGDVANEAAGAMEYLHSLRANQITGTIDQKDVIEAQRALNERASHKTEALGLNWESKGPDNQGGRTRDLIIDRNNSNILYTVGVAGGVFKSTNAGLSWQDASTGLNNLATVSIAQAANGDLYVGTGENMYASTNPGGGSATSPGMLGGGMYKSTDDGATWTLLSATEPPANTYGSAWGAIGIIEADPNNASRIYAATWGGLQVTNDGGTTWTNAIGIGGVCSDMSVGSDGSVWASLGIRTFYSPNGNAGTFTEISKLAAGPTDLPRSSGRQKYAISPQDPDVVYCVQTSGAALKGLYRTADRGTTWELIQEKTTLFDPLCATQCQGNWDLLLGVNPADKDHVFLGGITVWEWKRSTGWRKVSGFGSFYIHSDVHEIVWDKNNSNIVYITSDGGVTKSSDGGYTWLEMNKNYVTTQFYHMSVGEDRTVVGGTQDNGSWEIDGTGNTPLTGASLGPVDNFSGDGGYTYISWLDDKQYYTSYQSGRMGRSQNSGESFTSFYEVSRMYANGQPGSSAFSGWMVPYYIHETTNDPLSQDSVVFKALPSIQSEGFANGDTTFVNTLDKHQENGVFLPSTFKVTAGTVEIVSDANGNLSGDGYGTFDPVTGNYDVTFYTTPFAEIIVTCDVTYPAQTMLKVNSNINALPFDYQLPVEVQPNDSVLIQDPVQSIVAVGLNGSVWFTRMAHNWEDRTRWWKVANFNGTAQCITMSNDGNYIWAGTESGRVIRIANINQARSEATADIDLAPASTLQVEYDEVANYTQRAVTNIAVDPTNPDRVVITLGNYGNNSYVYFSNNATSANPTFTSKQGDLPNFPVYSATFDKANPNHVLIGTEYGVFTTENIEAGLVQWTEENNGLSRVPVFTLTQYRTNKNSTDANSPLMENDIYAGTHARGLFVTNSTQTSRPLSIDENTDEASFAKPKTQLTFYPNPAVENTVVEINLNKPTDVVITVRDFTGKLVKQLKLNRVGRGKNEININTQDLASGSYLVTIQENDNLTSGKLIVAK